MQLTLIGYGKMGQAIEQAALARGHEIVSKLRAADPLDQAQLASGISIDFTTPTAFRQHYRYLAENCQGVVVGTTGWQDLQTEVLDYFMQCQTPMIYASNFSLGANIYFELVKTAATLVQAFGAYDPFILEFHHKAKKDLPSGTAQTLSTILAERLHQQVSPVSVRSGWIKGIHEVGYESLIDKISLRHEAYTREGFAQGAVLAAEWLQDLTGVWDFQELMHQKFRELLG